MKSIWFSASFSIIALLPLFAFNNANLVYSSDLLVILKSIQIYTLNVASLSASVILLIELFLDAISKQPPGYMEYRILSLGGLIIYSLGILCLRESADLAIAFLILHNWHIFIEIIVVAHFLHEVCPEIFTNLFVHISILGQFISIILMYSSSYEKAPHIQLSIAYYIILYGFHLTMLLYSIQWMNREFIKYTKSKTSLTQWISSSMTPEDFSVFCILFGFGSGIIVYDVLPYVTDSSYACLRTYNEACILGISIIHLGFTLTTNILPARLFREKAIKDMEKLLVTRSMVQYIQHEMRTPVGVLQMGIRNVDDILAPHFARNVKISPSRVKWMLTEMQESIICVKDVLDDMLLYETLQGKTLSTTLELLDPIEFLMGSFEPYQSIASRLDVDFVVLPQAKYSGAIRNLLIKVDKKKLELAFRPFLLSSLIKIKSNLNFGRRKRVVLDIQVVHNPQFSKSRKILSRKVSIKPYETPEYQVRFMIRDYDSKSDINTILEQSKYASFERIARADESGAALGWWIAHEIIKVFKGNISMHEFDNDVNGKGIDFCIDLPSHQRQTPTSNSVHEIIYEDEEQLSNTKDEPQKGMRILIVDDSKLNRKMLLRTMEGLGHDCFEAPDGSDAVKMVQAMISTGNPPYDIILLDNQMPIMCGSVAIKAIRELGYKGIVFGVTGNALKEEQEEFVRNGVDLVLLKPMSVDDFMNALEKTLRLRTLKIGTEQTETGRQPRRSILTPFFLRQSLPEDS